MQNKQNRVGDYNRIKKKSLSITLAIHCLGIFLLVGSPLNKNSKNFSQVFTIQVVTLPETITQSETKQEKEEREIVKQKETFPNQTKEKRISTPQRSKSKELEIPSFSNESFKENLLSKIETTTSRSSYKKKTENKRQIEVSKVESSVLEVATSSSDTFIPEWYILLIKNKIKDNWKTSHTLGDRKTTVSFRVSKTGIIDNVSLEISSGNANFDISVLNAVKSTKKLPLFPNEISEPYLDIVIEFNTGG